MSSADMHHATVWNLITRLGEAQLLFPAAAVAGLALLRGADGRAVVARWALLLAAATLITLATKVAFIGWGIGSAAFDFTGISGHAMLAAAVYPVLFGALTSQASAEARFTAVCAGGGLALVVAVSRVVVGAHSVSEVVSGVLLGAVAGTVALRLLHTPRWPLRVALLAVVATWFVAMPTLGPVLPTHSAVTRLALAISGHTTPFTRRSLHRDVRQGWVGLAITSV